ncbi:GtrA family protein [Saccharopolyspora sp. HNM0983]|uniref:GtrA family protein n=1 Tax=Saccharopolyspora montiporae TaxID=2781240 RepID=A0A929BAP5_9PSEU|nr:GtrA family protein [Saccharopolyspora sp. HNM0983]
MSVVDSALARLPEVYRSLVVRHHEFLKFGTVGAITFVLDTGIFYLLKLSVLAAHPVTAKVLAVLCATALSYVLNREWSFRTRGGRRRPQEAALYFAVSAMGVALYSAPLWVSRYVLLLATPHTSRLVEEIADFTAGQVVGLLVGMAFRWWAFRRWVFPREAREQHRELQPSAPA